MSYNNTKLVAGLLGYALLACSISGYSFDSVSKTTTETSSESSSSATEITYLDADDKKVQLVLDSVNINCDTSATLYVKAADKVFVTLAADSDGFDAEETLQVDGGNIEVAAGDGTSGDSSSDTKDSSADNNSVDSNAKDSNAKGSNSNKKDDFSPPSGEDKKTPPNGDSTQSGTPPGKPDGSDSTEDRPEPPNGFDKNDNSSADSNSDSNSDSKSADLPDGNTIVSYSPSKEYSSVVISCADFKEGETYTLVAGDTSTSVSLNQK